jgi:hypothetical protein
MLRIGYRKPLGLMIRPAVRIVRELPPSLSTYRITLFFRAVRLNACYRAEYALFFDKDSILKECSFTVFDLTEC